MTEKGQERQKRGGNDREGTGMKLRVQSQIYGLAMFGS